MQILTSLTPEPTKSNPSLPPALDAFFRRAFQRAPGARFQSVREMTHALWRRRAAPESLAGVEVEPSGSTGRSKGARLLV